MTALLTPVVRAAQHLLGLLTGPPITLAARYAAAFTLVNTIRHAAAHVHCDRIVQLSPSDPLVEGLLTRLLWVCDPDQLTAGIGESDAIRALEQFLAHIAGPPDGPLPDCGSFRFGKHVVQGLTSKQMALLVCLWDGGQRRPIARRDIFRSLWPADPDVTWDRVKNHLTALRRALAKSTDCRWEAREERHRAALPL